MWGGLLEGYLDHKLWPNVISRCFCSWAVVKLSVNCCDLTVGYLTVFWVDLTGRAMILKGILRSGLV